MRMTVIGCGYLGAVHAACMADLGHDVVGVDVDEAKIEALAAGRAPFFEPGLPELLDARPRPRAGCGSPTDVADRRAGATPTCTSSASARRSARASTRPT